MTTIPGDINAFVEHLYLCILNRASDSGGKNFWVDAFITGRKDIRSLYHGFFGSPEYQSSAAVDHSNPGYVRDLYNCVLFRTPDEGGRKYWEGRLASTPRNVVLDGFLNSPEFNDRVLPQLPKPPVGGSIKWKDPVSTGIRPNNGNNANWLLRPWNKRLSGAYSPCTMIHKDNRYQLFFVGARGDRSYGGPFLRSLGLAKSSDGIHFNVPANSLIEHRPDWKGVTHYNETTQPRRNESEGVFSAGALLHNGTVHLYYAGLEEQNQNYKLVDGFPFYTTSASNYKPSDQALFGRGPAWKGVETFPVGIHRSGDGKWWLYYIIKDCSEQSGTAEHSLKVACGTSPASFPHDYKKHYTIIHGTGSVWAWGGGDPFVVNGEIVMLAVVKTGGSNGKNRVWSLEGKDPAKLEKKYEYDLGAFDNACFYWDAPRKRWLMYFLNMAGTEILVREGHY